MEEGWLVTWLDVQDRLGLGPDDGDVLMVNVDKGGREMIPEGKEGMEWEEEDNPYMMWLEAELMEMDVDRNTIDRVMGAEQQDQQIMVLNEAVGMEDGDMEVNKIDVVEAIDIIK